jgi:hypothetical protein
MPVSSASTTLMLTASAQKSPGAGIVAIGSGVGGDVGGGGVGIGVGADVCTGAGVTAAAGGDGRRVSWSTPYETIGGLPKATRWPSSVPMPSPTAVADNSGAANRNAARTPYHLTLIFPKHFLPLKIYEPDRTSDAKDQAALVGSP